MCQIIGQILSVEKLNRKSDGAIYYTLRFLLTDNKVALMFFTDNNLFESLSKVDRLSDLQLVCEIRYADERSFKLVPKSFEM